MSNSTPAPLDLLAGLSALAGADDLTVGKDGFNQHFNYGYMTEAALFTAARAALAAVGLSGTLSFPSGQHETVMTFDRDGNERPQILATVTAVLTIRDAQGQAVECSAFGQGMDPADKAYYKAQTGAAKYAVQKALLIAVESDDTDGEAQGAVATSRARSGTASAGGVASEKQLNFLAALVKKHHLATSDPEHMAWRLARMAGDPAPAFASISRAVASDVIDRLNKLPERDGAGATVVERLVAWETEQGLSTATPGEDDVPFTDPTAPPPDPTDPEPVKPEDADDGIPF
jgi:hypothetical protein